MSLLVCVVVISVTAHVEGLFSLWGRDVLVGPQQITSTQPLHSHSCTHGCDSRRHHLVWFLG